MESAVAAMRPIDTLAVPLGPGAPGAFLHSLGNDTEPERFTDLKVSIGRIPATADSIDDQFMMRR